METRGRHRLFLPVFWVTALYLSLVAASMLPLTGVGA